MQSYGAVHTLHLKDQRCHWQITVPLTVRVNEPLVACIIWHEGLFSQGRNAEYDLAIMMGRMNDMDTMCRKCADKMDIHIGNGLFTQLQWDQDQNCKWLTKPFLYLSWSPCNTLHSNLNLIPLPVSDWKLQHNIGPGPCLSPCSG